ncbi:MAG: DUF6588 family protein [archaeon]
MKKGAKIFSVLLALTVLFSLSFGESIEEKLQQMAADNAKLYVTPLVTAFGSGMNSGWFHSAKPHKLLGFDLGVKAMVISIPKDQQSFVWDMSKISFEDEVSIGGTDYTINIEGKDVYQESEVPTFFGKDKAGTIEPVSDNLIVTMLKTQLSTQGVSDDVLNSTEVTHQLTTIAQTVQPMNTPPGINLTILPLMVPQAAVGVSIPATPIKFDVVVRALPEMDLKDFGKFKFYGLGGKLALDPFIPLPMFGIGLSAGAYFQKMEIGKVLESNHSIFTLTAGRDFNLLILGIGVYGGVGFEKSDMKVSYTYQSSDTGDPLNGTSIKFDMKGDNKFRTTVGARLRLAVININADYSTGADNVLTAGVGLTLR